MMHRRIAEWRNIRIIRYSVYRSFRYLTGVYITYSAQDSVGPGCVERKRADKFDRINQCNLGSYKQPKNSFILGIPQTVFIILLPNPVIQEFDIKMGSGMA